MRLYDTAYPADPARDMAASEALLRAVAAGRAAPGVRVVVPGATLAFGRRDVREPGFAAASAAAQARGFVPVVRRAGGRAAAYDGGCVLVEEAVVHDGSRAGLHARFDATAARLAVVLQRLGVAAQVGELPGEYCPGAHSVHVDGRLKVAGVAQRVVGRAALVSSVVVVGPVEPIRDAISAVYAALGLPLDPSVTGALQDVAPALSVAAVAAALAAAFAPGAIAEPLPVTVS